MDGIEIIEKYQYDEYRRTHSNNWVAGVWVFAMAICAVFGLFVLVL